MGKNTHEKLIKAAVDLILANSYAGASIGMLADKVGVSKSTVIHYFKSKEGILLSIIENFYPIVIKEVRKIVENDSIDGVEKLKRFINYHMSEVCNYGDVLTIVIRETRYLGDENKKVYDKLHREYEGQLLDIIKQIQAEDTGLYKSKDSKIVTKAIIGMCNYATVWYKKGGSLSMNEISALFFDLVTGNVKPT